MQQERHAIVAQRLAAAANMAPESEYSSFFSGFSEFFQFFWLFLHFIVSYGYIIIIIIIKRRSGINPIPPTVIDRD